MNFEQLANYVLTFGMVALAVYRLSVMLAMENGPFDIFENFRKRLPRAGMLSKLFACPFCVSVWIALAGTPFLPFFGWGFFVVTWFALSGVAVLLVKRFG